MSLQTLVATGNALAISLIRQFLNNPIVGGIPIQATRFDCTMEAEVSRHVLINLQQGLQNVMDNVAPGPRTWDIDGYIGGLPGELTSTFMPSLFIMSTLLDSIFNSRQTTTLIDPGSRLYNVMIGRYTWSHDPAVANRIPIKLQLVEITVLQASLASQSSTPTLQSTATPTPGQANGAPAAAGAVPATAAGLPSTVGF